VLWASATIADTIVANTIKSGIDERHDSISDKKLGVGFLGMTFTVITVMLDGLCREYDLEVRKTNLTK